MHMIQLVGMLIVAAFTFLFSWVRCPWCGAYWPHRPSFTAQECRKCGRKS